MNTRRLGILFFILILPLTLYFLFAKDEVKNPIPFLLKTTPVKESHLAIDQWKTQNGVPVYFVPTEGLPIVDIQVDFAAGAARDGSKPGLALLSANLLSEGAGNLTVDDIAAKFDDVGAIYNAQISKDRAMISLRSLNDPKLLNPVVEVFATVLSNPNFPDANIENLRNETLVGLQYNLQKPNAVAAQAYFKAIYADHPYAHIAMGTPESVAAITKAQLVAFHQQYYVAKNAVLTIVGGITKQQAIELSNLITSKLQMGNSAAPIPKVPALTKATEQQTPFPTEQTHILMGQPCAVEGDPDYYPLLIGNYILGGNALNSRLFKVIREDRGLAYSVGSTLILLQQAGPFILQLQTKNDQAKEAVGLLKETLTRFVKEGPTEEEVKEAKEGLVRALPLEVNNNLNIKSYVSTLAFYQLPLNRFQTAPKQIRAVSVADIKSVFQRRIDPEKMALIVVGSPTN